MPIYIILDRNNQVLRHGQFKDSESARLGLKPITNVHEEIFEDLYVKVSAPPEVLYKNHKVYEFDHFITAFDTDSQLKIRYIWFDHGNGVNPIYDFKPKIISAVFGTVELLPEINEVVLADITSAALSHYLREA